MKGVLAILILVLIGLNVYNWWEIRSLRVEVAQMGTRIAKQEQSDDLMAQAVRALGQARTAIGAVDTTAAAGALDTARRRLSDAAKGASEKAGPALKWLEGQVGEARRQLGGQPGGAK